MPHTHSDLPKPGKAGRSKYGGTVNDVVLAVITGALARFFHRRGVDPEPADSRVVVPVNTYDGKLHWGFNADWDALPDLYDLVAAADRELTIVGGLVSQSDGNAALG